MRLDGREMARRVDDVHGLGDEAHAGVVRAGNGGAQQAEGHVLGGMRTGAALGATSVQLESASAPSSDDRDGTTPASHSALLVDEGQQDLKARAAVGALEHANRAAEWRARGRAPARGRARCRERSLGRGRRARERIARRRPLALRAGTPAPASSTLIANRSSSTSRRTARGAAGVVVGVVDEVRHHALEATTVDRDRRASPTDAATSTGGSARP